MTIASEKVKSLFAAAVEEHAPYEWNAFLDDRCQGDSALRDRVQQLLAAHVGKDSLLDAKPAGTAATLDQPLGQILGTQIGPYKLLEQIGEGGMGLVYMAEQQRPVKRLVALKIIKPGMDSKQVIARFEAERQALAMMEHPNIARILDGGTVGPGRRTGPDSRSNSIHSKPAEEQTTAELDQLAVQGPAGPSGTTGRPYFVMELVRGIPLNEFCEQKRLPVHERLQLFIQVCQAVQHAHQKGIIHRDLKPTNVLVTLADTVPVPKVIDFGIAKALGQSLTDHTLHTGFAQLIGTPLYMSPEQAEMNQFGVDTRSDVYSLGVILYELLTGTTPFDKERLTKAGFDEMRRIIREEEPETVSTRLAKTKSSHHRGTQGVGRRDVPRGFLSRSERATELDWIVAKSLEKDRTRRYESPSSLARDIERYLAGEVVQACPPSTLYRFRKFARRNKTALTTAALLTTALVLGLVLTVWQAIRATNAESLAAAKEVQATQAAADANRARDSEIGLRQHAEASEMRAEKNLDSALQTIDRLLTRVNSEDMREIPGARRLQRSMAQDVIDFFDRTAIGPQDPPAIRHRVAQAQSRLGALQFTILESDASLQAIEAALAILRPLVKTFPENFDYRLTLAETTHNLGMCASYRRDRERSWRETHLAAEMFAELADHAPTRDVRYTMLDHQAVSLILCGMRAESLNKHQDAVDCAEKAIRIGQEIGHTSSHAWLSAQSLWASLQPENLPEEKDELYRVLIAEHRQWATAHSIGTADERLADALHGLSQRLVNRAPDEADEYLVEALTIRRAVVREQGFSARPVQHRRLVAALQAQADRLRLRAAASGAEFESAKQARRLSDAESLYQEAIALQRRLAVEFPSLNGHIPGDPWGPSHRAVLVDLLTKQARYMLEHRSQYSGSSRASANQLAGDLLAEAIDSCGQLVAEKPDDLAYKSQLAALGVLRAQHFGPP